MLLIHQNQPQIRQRRKHRTPRPDHDPRPTPPDLLPLVKPFTLTHVTVQHRYPLRHRRKPRLETVHRLRRQRNLRHQHQHRLPRIQHRLRRLQVHLRLPAPRHPVQQQRLRLPRLRHRLKYRLQRLLLPLVQLQRLRRHKGIPAMRIPIHFLLTNTHPTRRRQRLHHRRPVLRRRPPPSHLP